VHEQLATITGELTLTSTVDVKYGFCYSCITIVLLIIIITVIQPYATVDVHSFCDRHGEVEQN